MKAANSPASARPVFLWGRDTAALCHLVRQTRSTLKILLKTRNEDFFIGKWLRHYLAILDPEDSIIVLDNISTSDHVFSVYRQYADRIILVQYEGHVDYAHSLGRFGDLYRAVWDSSLFYALLDTDEFLVLYDGRKIIQDNRILRYLRNAADAALFPPLFPVNVFGREDAFILEQSEIMRCHLHGKPILNSALMRKKLTRPVGHTWNLPLFLVNNRTPLNFILFHMTRLSREQRIMATMQKLRSFGLIADETDVTFLAHVSDENLPLPARFYVKELRWLLDVADERRATLEDMRRGHFVVGEDGALSFSSEETKNLFQAHVTHTKNLLDALGLNAKELGDPSLPLDEAMKAHAQLRDKK